MRALLLICLCGLVFACEAPHSTVPIATDPSIQTDVTHILPPDELTIEYRAVLYMSQFTGDVQVVLFIGDSLIAIDSENKYDAPTTFKARTHALVEKVVCDEMYHDFIEYMYPQELEFHPTLYPSGQTIKNHYPPLPSVSR